MKNKTIPVDFLAFLLPIALLLLWLCASHIFQVPAYLLPSPGRILKTLFDFVTGTFGITVYSGEFMTHSIASLGRVFKGFALALLFGLPLGIISGYFLRAQRIFDPFINLIRMIPCIGWLPLAMVWFGIGDKTTVFLIGLASFFPVYVNTALGVREVSPTLIRSALVLGADGFSLFSHAIIPGAMAEILSGMRLGLGISFAYLVLGELTGVSYGLGATMMDARMLGNTDMIIVCMLCIAFWGGLADGLLVFLIKKTHPIKEVRKNAISTQ